MSMTKFKVSCAPWCHNLTCQMWCNYFFWNMPSCLTKYQKPTVSADATQLSHNAWLSTSAMCPHMTSCVSHPMPPRSSCVPDMLFAVGEILCAALPFDRLHLRGASGSARKSERICERGRLRLTLRGGGSTQQETHTHRHNYWTIKVANVKKTFSLMFFISK